MIIYRRKDNDVVIPCGLGPVVCPDTSHNLQMKMVDSSTVLQHVEPDSGYYGLYRVIINPLTDNNLLPGNIRAGVTILGVLGTYSGELINLQAKTVDPTLQGLVVSADIGYDGLSSVTVNPVTADIDPDILAENIKKDVEILGVVGTFEGAVINNQSKTVNSSTSSQTVTYDSSYTGLSSVTVNPYTVEGKSQTITQNGTYTFAPTSADALSDVSISVEVAGTPATVQAKSVSYNVNGEYTVTPDQGYDGLSSVDISVNVQAAQPTLQMKTVDSSTESQSVAPDQGYDGLSQVTVNPYVAGPRELQKNSPDIVYEAPNHYYAYPRYDIGQDALSHVIINMQDVTADSSTVSQTIEPDNSNFGLHSVTVNPYTVESDSSTLTQNGTYTFTPTNADALSSVTIDVSVASGSVINNQSKTVNSSTLSQTVGFDSGYTGLSQVTVNPYTVEALSDTISASGQYSYTPQNADAFSSVDIEVSFSGQMKYVNPSINEIEVEPDQDVEGLSKVTVYGVTSSIDSNIQAGNIRDGVTILGVTGNYTGQVINNQNKTVNPSTNSQSITADSGYTGLGTVTVNPVNAVGGSETITQNGTYTFDGQSFGADYLDSLQIDVSVNSSAGSDWYIAWKLGNKHDMSDVDLSQVMTTYRGLYNMFSDNANPSPRYMSAPPVLGGSTVGMNGMSNAFTGVIFINQNGTEISFPNLVTASGMYYALSYTNGITKINFPELTSINGQQAMQGFFSEQTAGTLTEIYMPKMQNVSGQNAVSSWVDDYVTGMASRKLTVHVDALRYSSIDYNVAYWMGNSLTELVVNGDASHDIYLTRNPNLSANSVYSVLSSMVGQSDTGLSCNFYSSGLTVTDNQQGSIQRAYNTCVNAGWTINNLTILPYSNS